MLLQFPLLIVFRASAVSYRHNFQVLSNYITVMKCSIKIFQSMVSQDTHLGMLSLTYIASLAVLEENVKVLS